MKNRYYITTPLYYVNSSPHIGHAYTNIVADALSRFHKMQGDDVYLLTGTDEHGRKIQQAAIEQSLEVKVFVDKIVNNFKSLWKVIDIDYTDFIRTTEKRHVDSVKKALQYIYDKGDIYTSSYKGWYCVPCEMFWVESQIDQSRLCPDCKRNLEEIEETNYFFRMSKYQNWLIEYVEKNPAFIKPKTRYNEVLSFLKNNTLDDLCITRPKERLSWGIDFPIDDKYVTYVWFDALLNYISGAGFSDDSKKFTRFWPADVHFLAKDILRQHAIYWPIMLKALDLDMPKTVFSHGWWLVDKGDQAEKMSKSRGNVVDPFSLVEEFGSDALRFFLLKDVPLGLDGKFSREAVIKRINSDLANDLGNLVFRSINMIVKYFEGRISNVYLEKFGYFSDMAKKTRENYLNFMAEIDFFNAIESVFEFIRMTNKSIEEEKPWVLSKENRIQELSSFMYCLAEAIRLIAIYMYPFIPSSSRKILAQLGIDDCQFEGILNSDSWGFKFSKPVIKTEPLFPRIDVS